VSYYSNAVPGRGALRTQSRILIIGIGLKPQHNLQVTERLLHALRPLSSTGPITSSRTFFFLRSSSLNRQLSDPHRWNSFETQHNLHTTERLLHALRPLLRDFPSTGPIGKEELLKLITTISKNTVKTDWGQLGRIFFA
jgi:hypothetical protein